MNWNLGLNFYSFEPIIFEPNELKSKNFTKEIAKNKYHIYVVCKRKKVFFESCEPDGNYNITKLYHLDNKHNKVFFEHKHTNKLFIHSWSDGIFQITLGDEEGETKDYNLIPYLHQSEYDLIGDKGKTPLPSDLEVLYIGQAFGRTSLKTIDYRVSKHEKVQQIALDIIKKGSNEEVLVIGLKIKTRDFGTSFVSIDSKTKAPTADELKKLITKAQKRLTDGQEVTVFEASLIKYFKPDLNIEHKESFPSKDFPSYDELFKTDFDFSAVELNLADIGVRLYSREVIDRKSFHTQHYPLRTKSDKKGLFDYLYELNNLGNNQ